MSVKRNKPADRQGARPPAHRPWFPEAAPLEGSKRGPLPPVIRRLAQQMLADGASPEEVVAMSRRQGCPRVTLATVKHWMERNPELREIVFRRQVEAAAQLKRSLAGGEITLEARLPEAALARLTEASIGRPIHKGHSRESGNLRDSGNLTFDGTVPLPAPVRAQLVRENAALRRRARTLEVRTESILRRIANTQTRVEQMRWQVVQKQLGRLWEELGGARGTKKCSRPLAETVRRLLHLVGATR